MTDPEDWKPEDDEWADEAKFPTPWSTDPWVVAQRQKEWQDACKELEEAEKSEDPVRILKARELVEALAVLDKFENS